MNSCLTGVHSDISTIPFTESNKEHPVTTPSSPFYKTNSYDFGGITSFSSGVQEPSFPFSIDERIKNIAYQISSATWRELPGHTLYQRRLTAPVRDLTDEEFAHLNLCKIIREENQKILNKASSQAYEESNLKKVQIRGGPPSGFSFACGKTIPCLVTAWGKSEPSKLTSEHFQGHFNLLGEPITYLALCEGEQEIIDFCVKNFENCVQSRLTTELHNLKSTSGKLFAIKDALSIATVDLNNQFLRGSQKKLQGASLNTAFFYENRLWVMNLGDARAMLVGSSAEQIPLSVDNPYLRLGLPKVTRSEISFMDAPKGGWEGWHLVQTSNGIHRKSTDQTVALRAIDISLKLQLLHIQERMPLIKVVSLIIIDAYENGGTGNFHAAIMPIPNTLHHL